MVCDATYTKNSEIDEEIEESRKQHGFKNEREYLAFLLNQERQWESEHASDIAPQSEDGDG